MFYSACAPKIGRPIFNCPIGTDIEHPAHIWECPKLLRELPGRNGSLYSTTTAFGVMPRCRTTSTGSPQVVPAEQQEALGMMYCASATEPTSITLSASATLSTSAASPAAGTFPVPLTIDTTPTTALTAIIPLDYCAYRERFPWLVEAKTFLRTVDYDTEGWQSFVNALVRFETALNFSQSAKYEQRMYDTRPGIVSQWQAYGRKFSFVPHTITSISAIAFGQEYSWPFPLEHDLGQCKWGQLLQGSKNGVFYVILYLWWWRSLVKTEYETRLLDFAITDVTWVLDKMCSDVRTDQAQGGSVVKLAGTEGTYGTEGGRYTEGGHCTRAQNGRWAGKDGAAHSLGLQNSPDWTLPLWSLSTLMQSRSRGTAPTELALDDLEISDPWAACAVRNSTRTSKREDDKQKENQDKDSSEEPEVDEPRTTSKTLQDTNQVSSEVPLDVCPDFREKVYVYYSATATYYASGTQRMHREHIQATLSWFGGGYRFNCVFLSLDGFDDSINGYGVARIKLFMSFKYRHKQTGRWLVQPEYLTSDGSPYLAIIHLDTIKRATHLMPRFPIEKVPIDLEPYQSLEKFDSFCLNHYINHHAFDMVFASHPCPSIEAQGEQLHLVE
ncbi:hypothetical protein CERSUDRAFT_77606 [Gelatoporia subvermispora B]|uniref:Uncharacterized protein n=1 Tax=Ceriporiopsis subvermispora (strain B) TaxID=914234 RepID=M2QJM7_CERS8|nr:hypothetical protein CERSUDRAFT_77606 [Gelatoporia subvermispora B]